MTKRSDDNATAAQAKGSVHEAIGKLIGDDAVRAEGKAQAKAAAAADKKSPQD